MPSEGELVTLDVGGTLFKTTLTTLRQYQGSMLATMFNANSGRPPAIKVQTNKNVPLTFTVKRIFHYKRLHETHAGGRRHPGGRIHATSYREICSNECRIKHIEHIHIKLE